MLCGAGLCTEDMEEFGPAAPPLLGGASTGVGSLALHANGELYHNGKCIAKTTFKRELPTVFTAVADATKAVLQAEKDALHAVAVAAAEAEGIIKRDKLDGGVQGSAILTASPFTTKAKLKQWQLYTQPVSAAATSIKLQLWSLENEKYTLQGEQFAENLLSKGVKLIDASPDLPEVQPGWLIGFSSEDGIVPYALIADAASQWLFAADTNPEVGSTTAFVVPEEGTKEKGRQYSFKVQFEAIEEPAAAEDAAAAEGADAEGADAEGAKAEGADAEGTKAEGADAEGAKAEGANAEGAEAEKPEKEAEPEVPQFESTPAVLWGRNSMVSN